MMNKFGLLMLVGLVAAAFGLRPDRDAHIEALHDACEDRHSGLGTIGCKTRLGLTEFADGMRYDDLGVASVLRVEGEGTLSVGLFGTVVVLPEGEG